MTQSDGQWTRRTAWLIGGLLLFRLVYVAVVPLDLAHDEAYYWDWSRQPDWGYYSKPPLVAWVIALSTAIGGSMVFFVRLPAVLLGTLGLIWLYLLAARLYGRKAGFWSAALAAATPGNAALGLLMTIDAPLVFFWCAALYALWRHLEDGPARGAWLAAAILFTGLGLLSKETMLGFFPLALLFLLAGPEDRPRVLRPAFWIWVFGSLLFLAPVVWWNMRHQWITLQHSSEHFSVAAYGWPDRLARFGEFVGVQFAVGSPAGMALFAVVLALAAGAFSRLDRRARYLFCFSGVPMAGMLCLALAQPVQPNWTAAFVPAGLVLASAWALGQLPALRPARMGPRGLRWVLISGAGCVLATYLLPLGFGLQGGRFDVARRLRGWRELGLAAEASWRRFSPHPPDFVVTTEGRTMASEMAFYLPGQPQAIVWNDLGLILSQYDLWDWPAANPERHALIITAPGGVLPLGLAAAFQHVEPAGELVVRSGDHVVLRHGIWRGLGYLGMKLAPARAPGPGKS